MTVSMRVMSAGDGYKYLLRTVGTGDVDRSLSTPLTRYYNAEGTRPGRWMGAGLPALGDGTLVAGSAVSEAQLQLLISMGRDPTPANLSAARTPSTRGSMSASPTASRPSIRTSPSWRRSRR
mgnify:CR=1 FL=1